MIWELRHEFKIWLLIDIANIPRSTYYYYSKQFNSPKPDKYADIKTEIRHIYDENKGRYGYRRITQELKKKIVINHKTVQKLMRKMGIFCRVRMHKYNSYKGDVGRIAPNLLERDFKADKPNQKWVTDVTEFALFGIKLYLSPIIDLYNGEVISYNLSRHQISHKQQICLKRHLPKFPIIQILSCIRIKVGNISISVIRKCLRTRVSGKVCPERATVLTTLVLKTFSVY